MSATPQEISRLLAAAGFRRSDRLSKSGFCVSKSRIRAGAVRVWYRFALGDPRTSAERIKEKVAGYVTTITDAGWSVEAAEYELIVIAKAEEA